MERCKKRGPYQRDSRTTKWRKTNNTQESTARLKEESQSSITDIDLSVNNTEHDEFDTLVEELLEAGLEKQEHYEESDNSEDQQLYTGSRLTVGTSMLLIITYAMRHSLTGVALCDLLVLVELHCISDNLCRSTLKLYREFFQRLKNPVLYHYYCELCYRSLGEEKTETCTNCGANKIKYFLRIKVKAQLSAILNRPGNYDAIEKEKSRISSRRQSGNDTVGDVSDGQLYKDHFGDDGYIQGTRRNGTGVKELHISLQLNTDGVAIFRSSKFSVWPVYASINELPPNLRFKRENRIFLGLWYGYEKPHMKLLLGSMLDEMESLLKGERIEVNKSPLDIHAVVLSAVADAPARCLLLEFVQFNGNFGCPCCYSKGETCFTSERGTSHIYPYDLSERNMLSGHADLRTDKETLTCAKDVEKKYIEGKRREPQPVKGVKGISMLSFFPEFSFIRGTAIDYMHCVLLGIVKMLLGLWLNQEHREAPWSVRSSTDLINGMLNRIQPPNLISRMPRKIEEFSDWKASECRSFLLYYSVPVLVGVLPQEYFSHYCHLIIGIRLLLTTSISSQDIAKARCHLKKFVASIDILYGERYATFNCHSLLHLTQKVQDLGPLWSQSCFFYEGLNGDLRNMFHGTQQVELQIVTAVCTQQKIPELQASLQSGPAKSFYNRMMKTESTYCEEKQINGKITLQLGASYFYNLNEDEKLALEKLGFCNIVEVRKFSRILHRGFIIHCKQYKQVKRRNSYTVCCDKEFCQILCFVELVTQSGVHHMALVNSLNIIPNAQGSLQAASLVAVHVGCLKAISIMEIKEPVIFIEIDEEKKYVVKFPNFHEKD